MPQDFAGGAKAAPVAVLHKIKNGAVVGVVSYREIDPMRALPCDDDLIAVGVAHDGAVAAAFAVVELVALSCRVLAQIQVGFEPLKLGVHALPTLSFPYRPAFSIFDAKADFLAVERF